MLLLLYVQMKRPIEHSRIGKNILLLKDIRFIYQCGHGWRL